MNELRQNLETVQTRIAAACAQAQRPLSDVRLLAVSKTHSAAAIRALYQLGVGEFGENYAQELIAKAEALTDIKCRFVFIGTLQSNKIKALVKAADEIQTIASQRHAVLVDRAVADLGRAPYPVYINVNAGGEATKTGVNLADAAHLANFIRKELSNLDLQGIMAIPPPAAALAANSVQGHSVTIPPLYRSLRTLTDQLGLANLSLGMSDDLAVAIAAGSTCIRIGTALFGPRPSKP